MLASIARIAVSARLLGAEANGVWLGLQLVVSYGSNLHFGSHFGLFRAVPMARAAGDHEAARREIETSFSFTAGVATLSTPVLLLVTRWLYPNVPLHQVVGTVAIVILNLAKAYYNSVLKAESRFSDIAVGSAAGAVISFAGLVLIYKLGLDGLILGTALQAITEGVFYARAAKSPALRFDRRVLWHQLRVGIVTLLTSLGTLLLTTIDRTVMLQRLGAKTAGLYYIGANVMVLMPIVAALPAAVLTPQFFERVGRGEDVLPLVVRPVRIASLFFAILIAVGASVIEPTIGLLWPHLVGGASAAQAALFATYPLVLAGLVSNIYYAHDRQGLHVWILVASAAVSFGLAHLGVTLTHDVFGAAAGAAGGLFVYFPVSAVVALAVLGRARDGALLAWKAAPAIVYAAVVVAASRWVAAHAGPAPLLQIAVGLGVSVVAIAPLALAMRRAIRAGLV